MRWPGPDIAAVFGMNPPMPQHKPYKPPAFMNDWNLYGTDGIAVFDIDTCIDFKMDAQSKVSMFPVEKGSFTSYNKVQEPYRVKVQLSVGGDPTRIQDMIDTLEKIRKSTDLYHLVTPEATYLSCTLDKYSYERTRTDGKNLLTAHLDLLEVRQVSPAYTTVQLPPAKVKKPEAASKKDEGKQQPYVNPLKEFNKTSPWERFKQGFKGASTISDNVFKLIGGQPLPTGK